jgi:uncharacterized protein YjbI with pentapeptide repeats
MTELGTVLRGLAFIAFLGLLVLEAHAQDSAEVCPNPQGTKVSEQELNKIVDAHEKWISDPSDGERAVLCKMDLYKRDLKGLNLMNANLNGAVLEEANLQGANLSFAKLQEAWLAGADLSHATLSNADLKGADLFDAIMHNAKLDRADLRGAKLGRAKLQNADLTAAVLDEARLIDTELSDATLTGVSLFETHYEPISYPAKGSLKKLVKLAHVQFEDGKQTGLVLLRNALKEAGLRQLEREATYAIEYGQTNFLSWPDKYFRRVLFEWPSKYGLSPGRPLWLLLALVGVCTFLYMIPISGRGKTAIVRVFPKERIEIIGLAARTVGNEKVERLCAKGLPVLGYALYFSLVSAFDIGWRELNVGNWIARTQPREYILRGMGWVRAMSGLQSIVSVYLIALWALTYFGRPFE